MFALTYAKAGSRGKRKLQQGGRGDKGNGIGNAGRKKEKGVEKKKEKKKEKEEPEEERRRRGKRRK